MKTNKNVIPFTVNDAAMEAASGIVIAPEIWQSLVDSAPMNVTDAASQAANGIIISPEVWQMLIDTTKRGL